MDAETTSPEPRLSAAVRFHVLFHIARQNEAFISHTELPPLTEANRRRIIVKHDYYQEMFKDLLAPGVDEGVFQITDIPLADCYADMVFRLVGYADLPSSPRSRAERETRPVTVTPAERQP